MQLHFAVETPWGEPTFFRKKIVFGFFENNFLRRNIEYSDKQFRSETNELLQSNIEDSDKQLLSKIINGNKNLLGYRLNYGINNLPVSISLEARSFFSKITTIRVDEKDRWQAGRNIHFVQWEGKPYFSKAPRFAPVIPCVSTQVIEIVHICLGVIQVKIDGKLFGIYNGEDNNVINYCLEILANNDGFDSVHDFFRWFNKDFKGKIIHWTDLRY